MAQTIRGTEAVLLAADLQPGQIGVATDNGKIIFGTGNTAADNAVFDPAASGGSAIFTGLNDVNITTGPAIDGHAVVWDDASGLFVSTLIAGGVNTLEDMTDTNISPGAPEDGFVLTWDNATSKWIASAVVGGVTTFIGLSDTPANFVGGANKFVKVKSGEDGLEYLDQNIGSMSDVDLAGVATDHILIRGGGGDFGTVLHQMQSMANVDITGLADGDALIYNTATTKWEPQAALATDTTGVTDGQVLAFELATLTWKPVTSSGSNIYTADGTLTGSRTMTCANNVLAINDCNRFSATFGGVLGSGTAWFAIDIGGMAVFYDEAAGGGPKAALRVYDAAGLSGSDASAIFMVRSLTKGSISAPVHTEAQRDAVGSPGEGLRSWVSDQNEKAEYFYDGTAWRRTGAAYERIFNLADWAAGTPDEITITAATHLQGNSPRIVQIYEDTGSVYELVTDLDNITINKTTGDVVFLLGIVLADFAGKLVISA